MRRLSVLLTTSLGLALVTTVAWSPDASVAATRQSARLEMHPQIVQPGGSPAPAGSARSAMTATLRPIKAGRKVVLQRRTGTRWVDVSSGRESRAGVVEFSAPYKVNGRIATYRATALRYNGLRATSSSAAATNRWGAPAFDESFSDTSLGNWSSRIQGYGTQSQRHCAQSVEKATTVTSGTAALSVSRDGNPPTTPCPVDAAYAYRLNGMIGTQQTSTAKGFAFRYGYAAARIKFQRGAGQHAGFWLQIEPQRAEASAQRYEIDAIEWYGNRPNTGKQMSCQIHTSTRSYPSSSNAYIPDPNRFGNDWYTKYHVFSVQWTKSSYVFRIDGRQIRRISSGVSDQYEFLVLSLLSADWELKYNPDVTQKQTMNVDWVRVWSSDHT